MRAVGISSVLVLVFASLCHATPITVSSYSYAAISPPDFFDDNGYQSGNLAPTPTELTNGVLGTFSYSDPAWVGFEDINPDNGTPQPEIVFDLGANYTLNSVSIHYYSDESPSVQIYAPDSVNMTFSFNNSFGSPTLTNSAFNNAAGVFTNTFSLAGESGRYVRMSFLNDGHWTFLSEVTFDGDLIVPPPAPEPSSFLLLGLGGLGLTSLRRKRRFLNVR